eukprot:g7372.t1
MDASQLAVEARDLAIEEVRRLLRHPEDLTRLSTLRAEYERARTVNKLQLTSLVQTRVETARSSQELLERSQKAISKLKTCFEQIDHLCEECSSLVENHEKIQQLALAVHNITKTLMEIQDISDLPSNAEIADEMLKDDSLIMEAYKALTSLEGTSVLVQEAMKGNDRRQSAQQNLKEYFDKVGLSSKRMESRLWEHYANFDALSESNPGLLVACNQIIEMQEMVDEQLPSASKKQFKKRAVEAMEQSIIDRFQTIFDLCSKMDATPEDDNDDNDRPLVEDLIHQVIQEAMKLNQQLVGIYDLVNPCFPPKYAIFKTLWRVYHKNFAKLIDQLGNMGHSFSNKTTLEIIHWVESYKELLRGLGLEDSEIEFEGSIGLSNLMDVYIDRDKSSTTTWYLNILDSDVNADPKTDGNGKLYTPGFVDFFRIVNDSFAAIEGVTKGEMLFRSATSTLEMMSEFITAETAILQKEVPTHIFLAFANNNVRSYDFAIEFVEHFDEVTDENFKTRLEAENVYRGFLEVVKFSMKKLVEEVFSDGGMVGLLKKFYQSAEWQKGQTTESLIATLKDYLEDFEAVLESSVYKRVVEAMLETTINSCTSTLIQKIPNITEGVISRMKQDEVAICEFFRSIMNSKKVEKQVQALSDLRRLACADSVEGFVLTYHSILDTNPEINPSIVEKVCIARQDITRADTNEIIEQCRALYTQKVKDVDQSSSNRFGDKTTNKWKNFMGY